MRRGHRWMYRATGLPGWMRYGAGYGGGPRGYGAGPRWGGVAPYGPGSCAPQSRKGQLTFLKDEAESVKDYLDEVKGRLGELEKNEE